MHRKLQIKFPIQAIELETILRNHCQHHGVWDECMVYAVDKEDESTSSKISKDN